VRKEKRPSLINRRRALIFSFAGAFAHSKTATLDPVAYKHSEAAIYTELKKEKEHPMFALVLNAFGLGFNNVLIVLIYSDCCHITMT
jgi:hypothetical protein